MGEKIRNLSSGKIQNVDFEIELNYPPVIGNDQQVHIQSDRVRFEMDRKDYIKCALSVLVAEKNLKLLKLIK